MAQTIKITTSTIVQTSLTLQDRLDDL